MILSVDIDLLRKYKITFNQYFLCYLITQGYYDELQAYLTDSGKFEAKDIETLESRGFLINLNKSDEYYIDKLQITESFMELCEIGKFNTFFQEFWEMFPIKTPKGRRLKQASKHKIEKKYNSLVKKDASLHKHILKCLNYELEERQRTGNLEYLHNIETWLNKEGWKAYEDDDSESPINLYGGDVL